MERKQRLRPCRIQAKKVKLPQPSRNKQKISSETQTIYDSSSEQENNQRFNKKSQAFKQKLNLHYKPQTVIGRKKQKKMIDEFITSCLMKQITNRCLYISGCPGLGKTVAVMEIISQIAKNTNSKKASFQYINCLELKLPAYIYKQLLLKSKGKIQSTRKEPHILAIEFDQFIRLTKTHFCFVIDEVDFLYTKNQNVLYNLVEWCSQGVCNFSIIMIANTMDFPEKLAPKITSRMGSWRMCFKPYLSNEIKQIIQQRLEGTDFFESKAIDFAVKKFSMYTSDLRKIFNIVKQVVENRQGKKKIKIEDLNTVWNRLVEEEDISWKEQFPEIFNTVIEFIKKEGGKTHSYRLFDLLSQRKFTYSEVNMALADLRDMGIIKMVSKAENGVKGWSVTLVDGNI